MRVRAPGRRVHPLLVSVQVKSPTVSQSVAPWGQCAARHMGTVIRDTLQPV
jgi:hypothetical protein